MSASDLEGAIVDAVRRAVEVSDTGPRAYSAAEVADRLGVSDETVYRLVRAGHLRKVPHLIRIRIAEDELARFMAGNP